MFRPRSGVFAGKPRKPCGLRLPPLRSPGGGALLALVQSVETYGGVGELAARNGKKVSCDECFFGRNGLCALALDEPCATFRPDHPEGLRPPSQLRFVFRQERRRQVAWALPSAEEQAALHA
jgi:hypothetical protein